MLAFVFSSCNTRRENIKFMLGAFILFIMMGFKNISIGNDTQNYVIFFEQIKNIPNFIDKTNRFEVGFQIYCKLISFMGKEYYMLFIVSSIICMVSVSYLIKNLSINKSYSLFLFVGLRFFYFFLSGLRQSIAVSILMIAYIFLKKGKILNYILMVLLASSFHFFAIIFLFALPLTKLKLNLKNVTYIVLIYLLVYIAFNPIFDKVLEYLPDYYSVYLNTRSVSSNNMVDIINVIIPIVFIFISYITGYNNEKIKKRNNVMKEISSDTQIYFLIMYSGLSLLATRATIINRMVQYFSIFSICIIPNIIFSIEDNNKRYIFFFLASIFVIFYNITILFFRPEWTEIIPYRFFWN